MPALFPDIIELYIFFKKNYKFDLLPGFYTCSVREVDKSFWHRFDAIQEIPTCWTLLLLGPWSLNFVSYYPDKKFLLVLNGPRREENNTKIGSDTPFIMFCFLQFNYVKHFWKLFLDQHSTIKLPEPYFYLYHPYFNPA